MGVLTGLLTLPIAPVRGVVAVAEQLRREAERQFYDPAGIQRLLEDVDRRRASGELSDADADALEDELVERLLAGQERGEV